MDGIRGISIWCVLLAHISSHFSGVLHSRAVHAVLATLAYWGVTIFFVISGFLITNILMKSAARGRVDLKEFYRRRVVRIIPAAACYIAVVLVMGHPTVLQTMLAVTFTTTYGFDQAYMPLQHLWSLSVEEQFYLLWPLVFAIAPRHAKKYAWSMLILSPALRYLLRLEGYRQYSHLAPSIADSIAVGCLLALYQQQVRGFVRRYVTKTGRFALLTFVMVAFCGLMYHQDLVLVWGVGVMLIALVIATAIEREDVILNRGFLPWCGLLSYSLYLWQQPFLTLDGMWNNLPARLALTFGCAYLSYHFVEQPVLRWFSPKSSSSKKEAAATTPQLPSQDAFVAPVLLNPDDSHVNAVNR